MPTTRIVIKGLVHLLSDRSGQPPEAWLLFPNATDPHSTSTALGLPADVVGYHEPRLVLDTDQLDQGSYPDGLFEPGETCHPSGWSKISLPGRHVDLGENRMREGITADRTTPDAMDGGSSLWLLGDLDALVRSGTQVNWAPRIENLLADPYPHADQFSSPHAYPPLVARGRVYAGHLEVGSVYLDNTGQPMKMGFWNSTLAERTLAKELVLRFDGKPPTIRIRNLDGAAGEATLVFQSDQDVEVHLENAGPCDASEQSDFVAHYLLRQWPAGNPGYPSPNHGGPTGDSPQCSPTEGNGP